MLDRCKPHDVAPFFCLVMLFVGCTRAPEQAKINPGDGTKQTPAPGAQPFAQKPQPNDPAGTGKDKGTDQVSQPGKATPDGKLDEQAKAIALEFCKALLTTTDMDTVNKMVALPFFHQDVRGKVGKAMSTPLVAEKLDEMKQEIAAYMAIGNAQKKYGDVLKQPKLELKVTTYEQFLADGNTFGHVEFKKALDSVLKKSDRIVTISSEKKDEATGPKRVYVPFLTLVSWREDEPKVVGYTTPLVFRQKK